MGTWNADFLYVRNANEMDANLGILKLRNVNLAARVIVSDPEYEIM